ncbi:MAG: 8-oxo-dGTP diphosphatase [Candidatus Berkelbacteria bacterium]|nr:8-oxo-dGTP diphosphatase [Candidatus Berkelbacteria bacterium]
MTKPRDATLVFLVKKHEGKITEICLAMKKRGFGVNRWNGVGGKVESQDKTIEDAAKRETQEEIDVLANDLEKVAELSFYFPHNAAWNQMVHIYFSQNWDGEPKESEEMRPKWFSVNKLPYKDMWPDDIFWLPKVLKGELLKGMFKFGENDVILDKKITVVDKL